MATVQQVQLLLKNDGNLPAGINLQLHSESSFCNDAGPNLLLAEMKIILLGPLNKFNPATGVPPAESFFGGTELKLETF